MSKTPDDPHAQLVTAWSKLEIVMKAESLLDDDTPRLEDYAIRRFDPKLVIHRLLSPEPSYFAQKDILFAGLSTWTVCPHRPDLVRNAMVVAGASCLADLEVERRSHLPEHPFLVDIFTRISGPGIDFYQDFYYPSGGTRSVLEAPSPESLRTAIAEASREIEFAVEMMEVLHYHSARLSKNSKFRRASLNSGGKAVSAVRTHRAAEAFRRGGPRPTRTVDGLNCTKKAAPFKPSVALAYAATSIQTENESLLNMLRAGRVQYADHGGLLEEWIGQASYVAKFIIPKMYARDSLINQIDYLDDISPIEMGTPEFEDSVARLVQTAFLPKSSSGAT